MHWIFFSGIREQCFPSHDVTPHWFWLMQSFLFIYRYTPSAAV